MAINIEQNPKNLSANNWLEMKRKDEKAKCRVDCVGFSGIAEPVIAAGQAAIMQTLGKTQPTINYYFPYKNIFIWASASSNDNSGKPLSSVTQQNKSLLITILNTIR